MSESNTFCTSIPWNQVTPEEEARYNENCIEVESDEIVEGAENAVFLGSADHHDFDGGPEYLYWELNGQIYRCTLMHAAYSGTCD